MTREFATTRILALLLLCLWAQPGDAQTTAWLDQDPNAIWSRSPGFYEEEGDW